MSTDCEEPPSRRWDRRSFSEVRNLIIQTSEYICARLRVQQLLQSLVDHLDKGQVPPVIRDDFIVSDPELDDNNIDVSEVLDNLAMDFAVSLKEEYKRVIQVARSDLAATKIAARQTLKDMQMEGREEGMSLGLYNSFCRAAENRAEPQQRRRRKVVSRE